MSKGVRAAGPARLGDGPGGAGQCPMHTVRRESDRGASYQRFDQRTADLPTMPLGWGQSRVMAGAGDVPAPFPVGSRSFRRRIGRVREKTVPRRA